LKGLLKGFVKAFERPFKDLLKGFFKAFERPFKTFKRPLRSL
jgi:hypothetical protein